MNGAISLLVALAVFRSCESDETLAKFIRDYYATYNIHQIIMFACWSPTDAVDISRSVMSLDTVVTYNLATNDINLKNVLRLNYRQVGIVLDFDCASKEHFLKQLSTQLVFKESYYWLILTATSIIPTEFLQHLSLTIESEVTFATRNKTNDLFNLYDVYKLHHRFDDPVQIIYKGQWTPSDGLENALNQYKYIRRGDFHGLPLNFSAVLSNPPLPDLYTYLSTSTNTHLDNQGRSNFNFVMYLRDIYNFSLNLRYTNNWGYLVNGTLNGLIGDMIAGQVDMSISPFLIEAKRLDFLDYAVEMWTGDASFIFRHPMGSALHNNFLMPFTNDLWLVVIIVAAIYWLLLLLSLEVELHYADDASQSPIVTPSTETALTTVAALSQQGVSDGPNIISGRIVFLSLFLWSLLLYQFYSASIVSCLLTPPPRWIKSIRDLSHSNLEVGCQNITYFSQYFQTTTEPANRELNERKLKQTTDRPQGGFYPVPEGTKRAKAGGFAFIMDTSSFYKIIQTTFTEDEICEIQEVRPFKPRRMSPIIRKNSPFKKMIIYGLRRIVQSGLVVRIRKVWRAPRPQCPETHTTKPTPMSMNEFSPALFLLFIGVGVSICILIIEYLFFYFDKESRKKEEADDRKTPGSQYVDNILTLD